MAQRSEVNFNFQAYCFSFSKDLFVLANSVDLGEMRHFASFVLFFFSEIFLSVRYTFLLSTCPRTYVLIVNTEK